MSRIKKKPHTKIKGVDLIKHDIRRAFGLFGIISHRLMPKLMQAYSEGSEEAIVAFLDRNPQFKSKRLIAPSFTGLLALKLTTTKEILDFNKCFYDEEFKDFGFVKSDCSGVINLVQDDGIIANGMATPTNAIKINDTKFRFVIPVLFTREVTKTRTITHEVFHGMIRLYYTNKILASSEPNNFKNYVNTEVSISRANEMCAYLLGNILSSIELEDDSVHKLFTNKKVKQLFRRHLKINHKYWVESIVGRHEETKNNLFKARIISKIIKNK